MPDQTKVRVLAIVDYYLPGYKGGGPAVSVSRLVECLSKEFDFSVYTRDRDLGESEPYSDIEPDTWIKRDGINHYYASPADISLFGLLKVIRKVQPDVIYLNSYFSRLTRCVLALRTFGIVRNVPILIAPRGEFSPGALMLKALKKKFYLSLASFVGIHSRITWQVSSVHELSDTKSIIGTHADYFIKAPDIMDRSHIDLKTQRPPKVSGSAEFAFISRISPKKNLLGAIEMLAGAKGEVTFAIYGPIEDTAYWARCEAAIAALPPNIRCDVKGGIPSTDVLEKLAAHHFFLFPTLGENFGHVIAEALAAGCPVLLSDQTPWQDFDEQEVGWVRALSDATGWQTALQQCVDMDQEQFNKMSTNAKAYVAKLAQSTSDIEENRRLFHSAIANNSRKIS